MFRKITKLTAFFVCFGLASTINAGLSLADNTTPATPKINVVYPSVVPNPGGAKIELLGENFSSLVSIKIANKTIASKDLSRSSKDKSIVTFSSPSLAVGTYKIYFIDSKAQVIDSGKSIVYQDFEKTTLNLLNKYRSHSQKCGKTTYSKTKSLKTGSSALFKVAFAHSKDMATRNYFSHYTKGSNRSPFTRMDKGGVHSSYRGENIAAGYYSPEAAMSAWMKSEGHCKNFMNKSFTSVRIGVYYSPTATYGYYWTADLIK